MSKTTSTTRLKNVGSPKARSTFEIFDKWAIDKGWLLLERLKNKAYPDLCRYLYVTPAGRVISVQVWVETDIIQWVNLCNARTDFVKWTGTSTRSKTDNRDYD